jgi:hypothetical protein
MVDGGMLEFLPRNDVGFQHEIRFRDENNLPFVTGSLSAHESCAISAHGARKEKKVQEYKKQYSVSAEKDAALTCGRSLSLGFDAWGRSYWKFNGVSSLFVAVENDQEWHRFDDIAAIASIMVCLGKNEPVSELKRVFPEAAKLLKKGAWADILQKRVLPITWDSNSVAAVVDDSKPASTNASSVGENAPVDSPALEQDVDMVEAKNDINSSDQAENVEVEDLPYVEGEDVLVETITGKLLFDATVVAVSTCPKSKAVNGYRVHYKEWSSRFDEWASPHRVVEPSENNLLVQVCHSINS